MSGTKSIRTLCDATKQNKVQFYSVYWSKKYVVIYIKKSLRQKERATRFKITNEVLHVPQES